MSLFGVYILRGDKEEVVQIFKFKKTAENWVAKRPGKGFFVRQILGNPAAPAKAVNLYEKFHQFEPRKVGSFSKGFRIPKNVAYAGPAVNVMYRSDKKDPSTGRDPGRPLDYIHDHEKGVNVYLPGSGVSVPKFIHEVDTLVKLGDCLGFCFTGEEGDVEAEATNPLPELYAIPSGKALLVVQSKKTVLAIIWGGRLDVQARGIVY